MPFSQLAETLIGSEIVKLGNAIAERVRAGETIYNFTIGDFDPKVFPLPKVLEEEIIQAYKSGYTNYPPADGVLALRQAVSAFLHRFEGLNYTTAEIQIASGGRPLIYAIFRTVVDPGDTVIYATPSWNNNHYSHFTGAKHCVIETTAENNFLPKPEQIAPHLHGATLLCLCTPQNPTGTTLSKEDLTAICELVLAENKRRGPNEKKLYLLFDQMYWMLTFGNTQHFNPVSVVPEMRDYTIFVDGASKVFAATGIRVGWSAGPAPVINKMKAILSHVGAWAPMAEQQAVANFLQNNEALESWLHHFKAALWTRLQALYQGFEQLRQAGFSVRAIAPQAAIYLTIEFNLVGKTTADGHTLNDQDAVTNYLLGAAGLAIVPFYAFGGDRTSTWYRLSIGTCKESDIPEMFAKLKQALSQLH